MSGDEVELSLITGVMNLIVTATGDSHIMDKLSQLVSRIPQTKVSHIKLTVRCRQVFKKNVKWSNFWMSTRQLDVRKRSGEQHPQTYIILQIFIIFSKMNPIWKQKNASWALNW